MISPVRRVVRLTVLTPDDAVDLAVASDAAVAEIVRVTRQSVARHSVASFDGDDAGWLLTHPAAGPLDLDRRVDDVAGVVDGSVLHLRPREESGPTLPVDDVAERTRAAAPATRDHGSVVAVLLAILVSPVAVAVVLVQGGAVLVPAASTPFVVLACLLTVRTRPALLRVAAVPGLLAAVWSVALAVVAAGGTSSQALLVATACGLVVTGLLLSSSLPWPRPVAAALTCASGILAIRVGGAAVGLDETRADALAAVGVVVTVLAAPRMALLVSGLGLLDDRVARGEEVREATVFAAVARASDDLTALLLVGAAGTVGTAFTLADGGPGAAGLATAVASVVAARARSMLRARHVVPLAVGGVIALVVVVVTGVTHAEARAVPALVVGLTVLLGAAGSTIAGLHPVTASRLRRLADLGERAALLAVPLLLAGVFDLYRAVWEMV